jgi:hypothetical protein
MTERQVAKITVETGNIVLVRYNVLTLEDGVQVGPAGLHRESFMPGADISDCPAEVQAACAEAWG